MKIRNCDFTCKDCITCPFASFDFEASCAYCYRYGNVVTVLEGISNLGKYKILPNVLSKIQQSLTVPEMGGILGVKINDRYTVTEFYYDSMGTTGENFYTPDIKTLNYVISLWAEEGIEFIGFVHSHHRRFRHLSKQNIATVYTEFVESEGKCFEQLSFPDIEYANKIKSSCNMPEILMMIYIPDANEFYQYAL